MKFEQPLHNHPESFVAPPVLFTVPFKVHEATSDYQHKKTYKKYQVSFHTSLTKIKKKYCAKIKLIQDFKKLNHLF